MIYTVTFNPALDYVVRMEQFQLGQVNRTTSEEIQFGGKGINVSVLLKNIGVQNCALGFVAGFTGKALENQLQTMGVDTDFIHLPEGMTRINVKRRQIVKRRSTHRVLKSVASSWSSCLNDWTVWRKKMFWCWRAASQAVCPATSMKISWSGGRQTNSGSGGCHQRAFVQRLKISSVFVKPTTSSWVKSLECSFTQKSRFGSMPAGFSRWARATC